MNQINTIHPNAVRKVLIFGLPRTKTTAVQLDISQSLNLPNWSEAFSPTHGACINQDPYAWSRGILSGVVKLLTIDLRKRPGLNFNDIWATGWDRLVITQRRNMAHTACSKWYADNISKRYHFTRGDQVPQQQFTLDRGWLENLWLSEMQHWWNTLRIVRELGIEHDVIDYDSYNVGTCQSVAGHVFTQDPKENNLMPNGLDYTQLCQNYSEVEAWIKSVESLHAQL